MRAKRLLIFALCLCWVVAVVSTPAASRDEKRFYRLRDKANQAMHAGQKAVALNLLHGLEAMAPESQLVPYDLACAFALAGNRETALAQLQRAVDRGWDDADHAETDPDLESLHGDARFDAVIAAMRAAEEAEEARWNDWTWYRPHGLSTVPAFKSLKALDRYCDAQSRSIEDLGWQRNGTRYSLERNRIGLERLAILERYYDEHGSARDRERTILAAIEEFQSLGGWYPLNLWGAGGSALAQWGERGLRDFPKSESRARFELAKALGDWFAREPIGSGPRRETRGAASPEQFAAVDADLARIGREYPGAPSANEAAVLRLVLAHGAAGKRITPEVQARYNDLQRLTLDREQQQSTMFWTRDIAFQMKGLTDFRGVDTQGKTWDLAAMHGSIVLIDFWATWCGPCIGEFPHLTKAYEQYHDRGFEIVGVSLDGDDSKAFHAWLEKRKIPWPQIYDGKGWETPLARAFGISAIPFSALLDRDGTIIAIDPSGKELERELAKLLGPPEEPTAPDAANQAN